MKDLLSKEHYCCKSIIDEKQRLPLLLQTTPYMDYSPFLHKILDPSFYSFQKIPTTIGIGKISPIGKILHLLQNPTNNQCYTFVFHLYEEVILTALLQASNEYEEGLKIQIIFDLFGLSSRISTFSLSIFLIWHNSLINTL